MMGNGTVHSWTVLDKKGNPEAMGISFPETALEGLPDAPKNTMGPEYNVLFPAQAAKTPFTHTGIDWNPHGHEPIMYEVPHFDFHFYMIEEAERSLITLKDGDLKKCQIKPAPKMMPNGFIYAPGAEAPYMGAHWVALSSPEFHGKPFDHTIIYGSYNGKVIFIEPMISKAFLETKPNFHAPLPQPKSVAKSGFYPTQYGIVYDAARREYSITLEKFVWRSKSA